MSWEKVNINDICRPRQWKTLSTENLTDIGYPVYGANGKIGFYNEYTHEFPTLAITCRGATCGSVHITEPKSYINGNAMALDEISNEVDIKFLFYYFQSRGFNDVISGSAQPQITGQGLSKVKIPLPPLPIQKRIAEILDAADALKRKDEELLKKYDELAQAIFIDMFGDIENNEKGWEITRLGNENEVGSSIRVFVDQLVDEGIPFYRGTEIGALSTRRIVKPSLFITKEHYEKLKLQGGMPKVGDLLLPSICPDGRIFEVKNEDEFYFKDGRVLWIKVNKDLFNSVYLKFLLKEVFYRNYSKIASGTTFAELKIFALKDLKLFIPPINLQKQFANKINLIAEQNTCSSHTYESTTNLFNSLIQKAFKGELVA